MVVVYSKGRMSKTIQSNLKGNLQNTNFSLGKRVCVVSLFLIIIEALLLNENVFVSSKNSIKYESKNEHLSKELDARFLRHLDTNSTNDLQNNSNVKEENKVVQTVENANKTQESGASLGFLKEDVKNLNVDNLKENKTSENKEVSDNNSSTGKGSEEEKNKGIDSNKTKDKDEQKEEKGESLKVDLKESNKTQSKGSNSDLKDNQNAAPVIEEKKDHNISENKSDINPKNDVKTEIESLSEAYNQTKKSDDAPKKEENNNAINTSKTNKDSTPIADNKTDKDSKDSNKNDLNKPNEEYNDEWKEEDSIAQNAFAITICFFIVFIILFFYNLIKCYRKSTPQEKPIDTTQYSRELQSQTLDEDAVLDLTTN